MKILLVLWFLLMTTSTFGYEAKVDFSTILVSGRPGGNVSEHMDEAAAWLRHGVKIRVMGNQYSAAAMQVLWYHVHGGTVCTVPSALLYFHQPYIPIFRLKIGDPNWRPSFVKWFGAKNVAIIGEVTVGDWNVHHPSEFDIPQCD